MSGLVSQHKRVDGVDRFHGAMKARRTQRYVPRATAVPSPSSFSEAQTTASKSVPAALGSIAALPGNLDRFLQATTPSVPAQYLSKTMRYRRTCDKECMTYFNLEDLWDSFNEWSAYGAGVPLVLNGKNSVIQYYVPYLSGIQLYADSSTHSLDPSVPVEESYLNSFRGTSSYGSSMDSGSKYLGNWCKSCISRCDKIGLDKLSLRSEFCGDDSDFGDSRASLIVEYFENDLPFYREPLANKIVNLAKNFPVLRTFKSCDLLPSSWFSVAWYPIYRIPPGSTLADVGTCFLTFHFLSTPMKGIARRPILTEQNVSLPVFGLASLKCKGSMWTSKGDGEGNLAQGLLQAADKWLRLLNTNHP
ncbi:uncharacterized protein LOC110038152, partial [Phalaenopsis equestris]|uniref:uncharacterized protein LOC110038152 n=1 Tax=Phalaenopsis equestris TaxID=78828 RepID=UPI0009E31E2E